MRPNPDLDLSGVTGTQYELVRPVPVPGHPVLSCPVLDAPSLPFNFACLSITYLILTAAPTASFPLFPPQYRPCPLRHWHSASTIVYLLPVTTTDVAHRGFHIRLGAPLRRQRRQRRHERLCIPGQSTPRFSFITSHAHSHIL